MGCSLTLLLLIKNGLLFVVSEIFRPVTFNLWNQSVNWICSKVGFVIHNLTIIVWRHNRWIWKSFGVWESRIISDPVFIFQIRYNNSRTGVSVFSNGHCKLLIGSQLIFTVNQFSWHGLARIPLDPVLINLFLDSSQIIEALRTNRMHVIHEELRGVPFGEYLRLRGDTMILTGQRRQQCVVANLFLYVTGKKGKFRGDWYLLEKTLFNCWPLVHVNVTVIYRGPLALIFWHIRLQLDTCYYRQHFIWSDM